MLAPASAQEAGESKLDELSADPNRDFEEVFDEVIPC